MALTVTLDMTVTACSARFRPRARFCSAGPAIPRTMPGRDLAPWIGCARPQSTNPTALQTCSRFLSCFFQDYVSQIQKNHAHTELRKVSFLPAPPTSRRGPCAHQQMHRCILASPLLAPTTERAFRFLILNNTSWEFSHNTLQRGPRSSCHRGVSSKWKSHNLYSWLVKESPPIYGVLYPH